MSRDRRARATGRLGMQRGERYALIPREVMESEAYRAVPPWALRVLLALAVQFYGSRNGSLALPWTEAQRLGVSTQAQLYGSLQLLEAAELIHCMRRGRLDGGCPLATLYALTWRPIDEPATGVTYDGTLAMTLQPSHAWASWRRPADWGARVRTITARARGQRSRPSPYAARPVSQREERATHSVRSADGLYHSQREERPASDPTHSVCVTSEISASGPGGAA